MSGMLSRSGLAGRDPMHTPAGWPTRRPRSRRRGRHSSPTGIASRPDAEITSTSRSSRRPRRSWTRLRRRLGEPRLGLPVDPRAARGRPVSDLPVRGRVRAGRGAGAAPVARRCGRGSASPQRSRTSGTTRSRSGSRRPPSSTTCTPRSSPAMTKGAIAAEGQARGVPVAPVLDVSEVLASEHFESRGAFVDAEVAPGLHGRLPSGFCRGRRERAGFRHRAPEPGEHNGDLGAARRASGRRGRGRDRRRRAEAAARRAARHRLRDHRDRQRDRAPARRPGRRRHQDREPRLPRRGARGLRRRSCRTASWPAAATSAASA